MIVVFSFITLALFAAHPLAPHSWHSTRSFALGKKKNETCLFLLLLGFSFIDVQKKNQEELE